MSVLEAEKVLNRVLLITKSPESSEATLRDVLSDLGRIIQSSLHVESLRRELSQSELIWRLVRANLELTLAEDELVSLRVRLLRGVVILGRNLLSMDREVAERLEIRQVVFFFLDQLEGLKTLDADVFENSVVSAFQLLSNLTVNKKTHDRSLLYELVELFNRKAQWSENVTFTVLSYVNNVINDSDLLFEALSKGKGYIIMIDLLNQYEALDTTRDLDRNGLLLVKIFSKLIVHESFFKFTMSYNKDEDSVRFLKVAEALITSKKSWEVFELTVILSWLWELYQKMLVKVQDFFNKAEGDAKIIYEELVMSLDCLSSLVHFEHTRKFLLSYQGVELLISLLGILHKNIKPKKLKDSDRTKGADQTIEYSSFPHTKSMIIETLSALTYQNFEVQEQMRELHGLELVLSNCIIDDNEPFIKERSIVCLRFLLLNNDKNQEFVSKLEAQEAVPDETLDEAGFEVEIVDGKVRLKQKPKIEELHSES